jgi:uncharacterized OsmC-like protein
MSKLASYFTRKAEALAARQADWTANPAAGVIDVKAVSSVAGITGARPTRMGQHTVLTDSAPGLAGHALGPTAPEMLLGSLASCLVHTYLIQATLLNIPLDHVEVEVSAKLDMKGAVGMPVTAATLLANIQYKPRVESSASPETIEALHQAVDETCPVLNTLRAPRDIRRARE